MHLHMPAPHRYLHVPPPHQHLTLPLQASPEPGVDKACNFETFSGQAELEERLRQIEDRMQQLGWGAQRMADVLGLARWVGGGVGMGCVGRKAAPGLLWGMWLYLLWAC
jgi:hypothetical protein